MFELDDNHIVSMCLSHITGHVTLSGQCRYNIIITGIFEYIDTKYENVHVFATLSRSIISQIRLIFVPLPL